MDEAAKNTKLYSKYNIYYMDEAAKNTKLYSKYIYIIWLRLQKIDHHSVNF